MAGLNIGHSSTNDEDDTIVTIGEVLQEVEELEDLEDEAEAVLGGVDDSKCTYHLGYMKRQPLYVCVTCCPSSSDTLSGICLGCSYHCHENHELIELYTKRNFKCDCGTPRLLSSNLCKLSEEKSSDNEENCYNQNFKGKYCICNRPYPDQEDTTDDTMTQCIVCEDWYHGRHLDIEAIPSEDEYSEMICHNCVSKLSFLSHYSQFAAVAKTSSDVDLPTKVDVSSSHESSAEMKVENKEEKPIQENGIGLDDSTSNVLAITETNKGNCKLKNFIGKEDARKFTVMFFKDNWRKELCTCGACKELYKTLKVPFLTDPEDTLMFYESEGRAKRRTSRGVKRELEALSSLDRVTRMEVIHEFNNMSSSLMEYLGKFLHNGKVVRTEDIEEFFSQLQANKKQRKEGMQHFCK